MMKSSTLLNIILENIDEHKKVINSLNNIQIKKINEFCKIILESIKKNGTIYWCGNGGSASDSQHLAAELIGRYKSNRKPLRSISLNADTSVLTCISNDFGYEEIFSRQIDALAQKNDILIVISTSGNSTNILKVIKTAKEKKIKVIGLLGNDGGKCKKILNKMLIINSKSTARIQEMHIMVGHIICDVIEREYGIVEQKKK